MRERITALIRLLVALVPAINIVLVQFNMSPLPFTQEEINVGLSAIVAVLGTIWAWWKNNNITLEAQTSQKILDELKRTKDSIGGEGDPLEVE